MSEKKKDLTRIEDLGEFLHEADDDEESFVSSFEAEEEPSDVDFGTSFDGEVETSDQDVEEDPFSSASEDSLESLSDQSIEDEEPFKLSSDFQTEDSEEERVATFDETSLSFKAKEIETEVKTLPEEETSFFSKQEADPVRTLVQEPIAKEIKTYRPPEDFSEVKKFAESTSFTGVGAEGNPSFSVLIKNVRYVEDVNDILALLGEMQLMADSEEQMKVRLMRGHLLVPRISEFAAILLAHKLRRFDVDIQVGLADEIHPPKHGERPELGLVTKFNLHQNQSHHFQFDDAKLELSQIMVSATSGLEGYQVVKYLGVASEHKMLDGHTVEDEGSEEVPRHYHELAQKLKAHALKAHSNAVVGLNYQLTPLPSEYGGTSGRYRLTCTGNLVWVNKL